MFTLRVFLFVCKKKENFQKVTINVAQYTSFLNAVATVDPYRLYDQAMESHASIIRSRKPGCYQYSIIDGHQNDPMTCINASSAMRFCNWLEHEQTLHDDKSLETTEEGTYMLSEHDASSSCQASKNFNVSCFLTSDEEVSDPLLRSNTTNLKVIMLTAPTLALASSNSNHSANSYINDAAKIGTILGVLVFGSIGMVKEDDGIEATSQGGSDEETNTTRETISNRSSESQECQKGLYTEPENQWKHALQQLQDKKEEWYQTCLGMIKEDYSPEVNSSLLRGSLIFQDQRALAYLTPSLEKINEAANQYNEAKEAFLIGNNIKARYYDRAAIALKQAASQDVTAAECLLKSEGEYLSGTKIQNYFLKAKKNAESAASFYFQKATACKSQDETNEENWHTMAWIYEHRAGLLQKMAVYSEEINKSREVNLHSDVINFLNEAIERGKAGVRYYGQAFEKYNYNREDDPLSYKKSINAALAAEESAEQFEKAAVYLRKAIEVSSSSSEGSALIVVLKKASKKAISQANYYLELEEAYLQGDNEKAKTLKNVVKAKENKINELLNQAERLKKLALQSVTSTLVRDCCQGSSRKDASSLLKRQKK